MQSPFPSFYDGHLDVSEWSTAQLIPVIHRTKPAVRCGTSASVLLTGIETRRLPFILWFSPVLVMICSPCSASRRQGLYGLLRCGFSCLGYKASGAIHRLVPLREPQGAHGAANGRQGTETSFSPRPRRPTRAGSTMSGVSVKTSTLPPTHVRCARALRSTTTSCARS